MSDLKNAPPHIFEGEDITTYGKLGAKVIEIAEAEPITDKTEERAKAFFDSYVTWLLENSDKISDRPEAERCARSNIGYLSGYYDRDTAKKILETFDASHPIFGSAHTEPDGVSGVDALVAGIRAAHGTPPPPPGIRSDIQVCAARIVTERWPEAKRQERPYLTDAISFLQKADEILAKADEMHDKEDRPMRVPREAKQ